MKTKTSLTNRFFRIGLVVALFLASQLWVDSQPAGATSIVIYQTGFETDMAGWTVADTNSLLPEGEDFWGRVTWSGAARTGSGAAWCAANGTNSTTNDKKTNVQIQLYDNRMDTSMSRVIDLRDYSTGTLVFYYNIPSGDPEDKSGVAIRDIGQLWINGFLSYPALNQIGKGWIRYEVDLSEYARGLVTLDWIWRSDGQGIGEGLYIDDITVTTDPPPAAVSNLAVSKRTGNSVTLGWTAPGADGNTGTATEYDIRYSTSLITDATWSSATQVTGEPAPQVAGTSQSFTVRNLNSETTYYFAMKTRDQIANNWSALSNVVSVKTSIAGDINGDGTVNIFDLVAVGKAFGSTPTSPNWNADADANGDNTVNIFDLVTVGKNFGRSL